MRTAPAGAVQRWESAGEPGVQRATCHIGVCRIRRTLESARSQQTADGVTRLGSSALPARATARSAAMGATQSTEKRRQKQQQQQKPPAAVRAAAGLCTDAAGAGRPALALLRGASASLGLQQSALRVPARLARSRARAIAALPRRTRLLQSGASSVTAKRERSVLLSVLGKPTPDVRDM